MKEESVYEELHAAYFDSKLAVSYICIGADTHKWVGLQLV